MTNKDQMIEDIDTIIDEADIDSQINMSIKLTDEIKVRLFMLDEFYARLIVASHNELMTPPEMEKYDTLLQRMEEVINFWEDD